MKKIFYIFALVAFSFTSCQQLDFDEEFQTSSTKNSVISKFNVSLSDVNTLVDIMQKNESKKQLENIEPLAFNGDTMLYIVNYKENKGWRIISGDRRTTSVLASAEDGVFNLKEINPGVGNWLVELADNILALKHAGKQDTTMGDFILWKNIDKFQESQARASGISKVQKIISPDQNDGYWELYDVTSTTLPSTQVGPLLPTKWGQGNPWNTCVPTGKGTTQRCVTGCVAVAGAQTLYYLHYNIGVPVNAFTTGSCWGYSNSKSDYNFGFSFSNPTATAWDNMARDSWDFSRNTDLGGILMGWVGMNIKMNYTLDASGANTEDLAPFYNSIGINCTYKDYNSTELFQNLQNRKPVILSAYATKEPVRVLWITWGYNYKDGHAFVADGYETRQTKFTYHYQWVNGNGTQPMYVKSQRIPIIDESYKTEEYISTSNLLMINWGWNGSGDNGRYSYNGDWNAGGYNFQYKRSMIIGFTKK